MLKKGTISKTEQYVHPPPQKNNKTNHKKKPTKKQNICKYLKCFPILTPIRKTLILQQAPHPPNTPMTTRNIPSPISAHARPLTTLDNAGMSSKAFSTEAIKSAPTTTRDPAAISANPMS